MIAIGIDNGTSGTIGIIAPDDVLFFPTPVIKELNYTKKAQYISRVDHKKMYHLLSAFEAMPAKVLLERPYVGQHIRNSQSAARTLESTLIVLELLRIPYDYIDSKEWQKALLPKGITGTPNLKKASMQIGIRLFPQFKDEIEKHGDADGLLIAEYNKRQMKL